MREGNNNTDNNEMIFPYQGLVQIKAMIYTRVSASVNCTCYS